MAFVQTEYGAFFYFAPDAIGQAIASGTFFDGHLKPYMDKLDSKSVLIDVGANIGFFTVYAALKRKAFVVAFEPSAAVFDLLNKNVTVNRISARVHLCNIALYDSACQLKINPDWNDWPKLADGAVDYEHHSNSGGLSLVRAPADWYTTFDALFLDYYHFEQVDLLKIDTQGSDLRILVGGLETINRCRPVICFEFEPNHTGRNAGGDALEDFYKFFEQVNYSVKEINQGMTARDFVAEPL